jgi:Restriction endonuclease
MLVQYLVGLCCLRWDPAAVDVTIGDMVYDDGAGKERDVDVTVTISEEGRPTHAFKAYEVKREGSPLDVTTVEQLCIKMLDMPSVTHRAIVSSSGYTSGAQTKANRHGVELYTLCDWTRPLQEQFPELTMSGTAADCFPMTMTLLCWPIHRLALVAPDAKSNFSVQPADELFDFAGAPHSRFTNFANYTNELLLRSTEILLALEPATEVLQTFPVPMSAPEGEVPAGPAWPHTHTLDVSADGVYVQTSDGLCRLTMVTINGQLQWQRSTDKPLYYVIERISDGTAFAGALIAKNLREGQMTGLVFSPKTREISVHFVRLAEKHHNAIRKLKLESA